MLALTGGPYTELGSGCACDIIATRECTSLAVRCECFFSSTTRFLWASREMTAPTFALPSSIADGSHV
jgi:hypothetical protein